MSIDGICTPDDDITYNQPTYEGPSIGPLTDEEAAQGAEGYNQQQEYEENLRQWTDEPFEGTHEAPEEPEQPEPVFD